MITLKNGTKIEHNLQTETQDIFKIKVPGQEEYFETLPRSMGYCERTFAEAYFETELGYR